MNAYLVTDRRKFLHTVSWGDPNRAPVGVWDFSNDVEPGGINHYLTATGTFEVAGYSFVAWSEHAAQPAFLDRLFGDFPTARRSVTLFIHGYNTDFKAAVGDLDGLARGLAKAGYRGAVLGYDWPSAGGVHLYTGDRARVEASVAQAYDFLSGLRTACVARGARLNLVCHSMGAYLATLLGKAFLWQAEPPVPWLDHLLLLAADVPRTLFDTASDGTVLDPCGRGLEAMALRVDVLYSPKDGALQASENLEHPDEPRLGRVGPDGPLPDRVAAADLSGPPCRIRSHGDYFKPRALKVWADLLS